MRPELIHPDMPLSGRRYVGPEVLARLRLPRLPDRFARVRDRILTSAYVAGHSGRSVSYSRNRSWYVGRPRYEIENFTYKTVTGLIDDLVADTPWLTGVRAKQGDHRITGLQSTITATPELMAAMSGVKSRYGIPDSGLVVLRNAAGDDIDYRETAQTGRMRDEMLLINAHLRRQTVEVPTADEVRGETLVMRGRKGVVHVTPHDGGMRRVFNRSSFQSGGRLYGWWQSIPKRYRLDMLLDGEPVCEPDFSSFHAHLVYARAGIRVEGDAYEVGQGIHRDDAKAAFVIGINAKTDREAIGAIAADRECEWEHARDVYHAVKNRHAAVSWAFGSDQGVGLMAIDGRITTRITLECVTRRISVLPIHDSFNVRQRDADEMATIMETSWDAEFGPRLPCPVKTLFPSVLQVGVGAWGAGLGPCPSVSLVKPEINTPSFETAVICSNDLSRSISVAPVEVVPEPETPRARTPTRRTKRPPDGDPRPVRKRAERARRPKPEVDVHTMPLPPPRKFVPLWAHAWYERRCREHMVSCVACGDTIETAVFLWRQSIEIAVFGDEMHRRYNDRKLERQLALVRDLRGR